MTMQEAIRAAKASKDNRVEITISLQAADAFENAYFRQDLRNLASKGKPARAYLVLIKREHKDGVQLQCLMKDGYSKPWHGELLEKHLKHMALINNFDIEAMI